MPCKGKSRGASQWRKMPWNSSCACLVCSRKLPLHLCGHIWEVVPQRLKQVVFWVCLPDIFLLLLWRCAPVNQCWWRNKCNQTKGSRHVSGKKNVVFCGRANSKGAFFKFEWHRKAVCKISLYAGRQPSPVNNRRFCNVQLAKHSLMYSLYKYIN